MLKPNFPPAPNGAGAGRLFPGIGLLLINLFLIFGTVVFSSCGKQPHEVRSVGKDISQAMDSLQIPSDTVIYEQLIKSLKLDVDTATPKAITIVLFTVGTTFQPEIAFTVELEAGNPWFDVTLDRIKRIKRFKAELFLAIQRWRRHPYNNGHTRVHDSIAYMAKQAGQYGDSLARNHITLYSDGWESSSDVEFYDFRDKPQALRDSFEVFSNRLNSITPLDNHLEGVTVEFIYSPRLNLIPYEHAVQDFWNYHLTKAGATVIFSPSGTQNLFANQLNL